MRIISGKYRGRTLRASTNKELRPTQDRVKESLFNVLAEQCDGATCLDLFAGSGSLGLEALSRGAAWVDFVEKQPQYLKKNVSQFSEPLSCQIHSMSAFQFLKQTKRKYELIFLDPPWTKESYFLDALKAIFEFDILAHEGTVVCEHSRKIEDCFDAYAVERQRRFGDTSLTYITGKNK